LGSEKQTQTKPISISPQTCSGGLKTRFEKTKPIWRKGERKNESKSGAFPAGLMRKTGEKE
jgi:hypothetical protein